MSDKIFPKGISIRKPSDNAPDFIKSNIGINVAEFLDWAEQHMDSRGWVNLDLKLSKEGKQYLELNTFKKTANPATGELTKKEILNEDLPF